MLYVSDNRVRGNYGCRATSTALSQLVGESHEIVGRITGRYTHFDTGELFFARYLPGWVYRFLGRRKHWLHLRTVFYRFFRLRARGGRYFFGRYDFVSQDLGRSAENLLRCLPANPQLGELDLRQYEFDAMVVNGEGSFLFSTPPWRESLVLAMLMNWAQQMGKKVFLMNAMFSDDPHSPHNAETAATLLPILQRADGIALRDPHSGAFVERVFPGVPWRQFPDALFTWYDLINDGHQVENGKYYMPQEAQSDESYRAFDFSRPYICISASSAPAICREGARAEQAYCRLVEQAREALGLPVFLVQACEGDDFLGRVGERTGAPVVPLKMPLVAAGKILANARLYLTGRYHPAILASLGGTPCVFMASNSHKTLSLQELLGVEAPREYQALPDQGECARMVAAGGQLLAAGEALRGRIRSRCRALAEEARQATQMIRL